MAKTDGPPKPLPRRPVDTISRWMRMAATGVSLVGIASIALHFVSSARVAEQQEQLRIEYQERLGAAVDRVEQRLNALAGEAISHANAVIEAFYRANAGAEIDRVLFDRTAGYDIYLLDAYDETFDLPDTARSPFVMRSLIQQSVARNTFAVEAVRAEQTALLLMAVPVDSPATVSSSGERKWIAVTVHDVATLSDILRGSSVPDVDQISVVQDLEGIEPLLIAGARTNAVGAFVAALDSAPGWRVQIYPSAADALSLSHVRSRLDLVVGAGLLGSGICLFVLAGWRGGKSESAVAAAGADEPDPEHPVELPIYVAPGDSASTRSGIEPKLSPAAVASTAARTPSKLATSVEAGHPAPAEIDASLFRSYDIRGADTALLAGDFPERAGRAFATLAMRKGESAVHLCRDGRHSSPEIAERFKAGVVSTGCDLIDLGVGPTPLLSFAVETNNYCSSGVMVTGSHNPPGENGLKLSLQREMLQGDAIQELRAAMVEGEFSSGEGQGFTVDYQRDYLRYLLEDVVIEGRPRIVVDGGNGAAGPIAVRALEALGCEVEALFCDIDGTFPNRPPDNTRPGALATLIERVRGTAELGVAFDGDGDRLVAVTGTGTVVMPDQLMMLLAADVLVRQPGAPIVYDVKCSRALPNTISRLGGRPVICRSGRTYVAHEVQKHRAPFGGEFSGHLFFPDRWYPFDDAIYAAARLVELVSRSGADLDQLLGNLPALVATEELFQPMAESRKEEFLRAFRRRMESTSGRILSVDGVRVEFPAGWGLVRASNTSAALSLRFEATDESALAALQQLFRNKMAEVDPELEFRF